MPSRRFALSADFDRPAGNVAPGFDAVAQAFAANFADGLELGAAFAVVKDGRLLVDLRGGHADRARRRPVTADTLFNVWSVSKGVAATCVALLVERGRLDYDARVTCYWPEFGAHGKDRVTLAQLLSHQAGVPGVRAAIGIDEYYLHDRLAKMLAAEPPFFEPGSSWGYHALSMGVLVDELVRRSDGRTLARFFAEEIAIPFDLDIHMGVSEADAVRLSEIVPPASPALAGDAPAPNPAAAHAALGNPPLDANWANSHAWQRAGIPAGGVSANARSLARLFGLLAGGASLLSTATIDAATRERIAGVNQCTGTDIPQAAGYQRNRDGRMGPSPGAFGHAGWGGSIAFADPANHLGIAFVVNRMRTAEPNGLDRRLGRLLEALYQVTN